MSTKQELVTKLNAEVVGGNCIAGPIGGRVFVGKINEEGVFFITPEGEEMLKALEETPVESIETTESTPVKMKAIRKKEAEVVVEDDIAAAIAQAK
jgi:hypothetical protein